MELATTQEKLWHKQFRAEPSRQAWLVAALGVAPLVTTLHGCMAAWAREGLGRGRSALAFLSGKRQISKEDRRYLGNLDRMV